MTLRRILCEGPDDRAALRELLTRGFEMKVRPRASSPPDARVELVPKAGGDLLVEIVVAGSDEKVLARAVEAEQFGSPATPVEILGLCFDPNGRTQEEQWRAWIEAGLRPLNPQPVGDGWRVSGPLGAASVLPLPWQSPRALPHYGLPDKHSLERIVIQALAEVHHDKHCAIADWTCRLSELKVDQRWVWKSALRLWNALVHPDVSGAALFDQLCGQDHAVGGGVRAVLEGTPLWLGLSAIAATPPLGLTTLDGLRG